MFRQIKLLVVLAGALGATGALAASGAGPAPAAPIALLKAVTSRVNDRIGVVTIESSGPVPYTASQPDARTYLIELRDIEMTGFTDRFKADPRHPVGAIQIERAMAADGAPVTRVRMTLTQPVRPHVHSSRNVIYVEADRADLDSAGRAQISSAGPASVIRDVRATLRGSATAVTLYANGRLDATTIQQPKDGPLRLEMDLPNVTSAMPGVLAVAQGPVERVRIGLNPRTPLVTRVVMDLNRPVAYRVEQAPDGQELTVVFDEPVAAVTAPSPRTVPAASAARVPAVAAPYAPSRQATVTPQALTQQTAAQTAPPVVVPAPMQLNQLPESKRYTGHAVSLDFQGADLRAVLRTFAEISGLNVVIDPTIQGSVDVALRDVPWDQALDIILRSNKLGYSVDGTIVRIAPLTILAVEEKERRELAEAQANAGELVTLTRALSYAKAEDVVALLKGSQVLSSRGNPTLDPRTNTLIVTDLPARLARVNELIATLDQPQPQVEIEARIVQTTREFARTLGVQWGMGGRASQALGNTLPVAFPNQGSITGRTGGNQGPPAPDSQIDHASTVVNLGVNAATTAIGLALGSVNGALNLDVALSALERQGQGRLLSTPRVSTQNNVEAEITQGVQIPIQTVSNNTVTVAFKDAALTLKVTPQITAANTVIMRISVVNASPDFSRAVNNIPPINTQRAETQVLVSNGETTVIGGIYVSQEQSSQDRTPGLHRLPLLGWLFKRDGITDESRELLIFITPRIIRL